MTHRVHLNTIPHFITVRGLEYFKEPPQVGQVFALRCTSIHFKPEELTDSGLVQGVSVADFDPVMIPVHEPPSWLHEMRSIVVGAIVGAIVVVILLPWIAR